MGYARVDLGAGRPRRNAVLPELMGADFSRATMAATDPKGAAAKAYAQSLAASIKGAKLDGDKVNKWLTFGANMGVLAGLILVAFEINQATLTTRADMISNFQDRWIAMDMSWQDAEFAAAWAKAMDNSQELSRSEMIQVSGHLWAFIDHINSARRLWELGVFAEPMATPAQILSGNTNIFFGNEFAQLWWAENKKDLHPELVMLLDAEIEKISTTHDLEYYERLRPTGRD
jgi:hypothetical protein